jgi:DNA-directed RNA polymerase subunit RPC12/RpoP
MSDVKIGLTPRDERRGYKCYVCGETFPVVLHTERTTARGTAARVQVCPKCALALWRVATLGKRKARKA